MNSNLAGDRLMQPSAAAILKIWLRSHVVLSDQTFGNVYPLTLQGKNGASGAVPDHVDRNLIYDLIAGRVSIDPSLVGVSFCACLFDQSHWEKSFERGQPGFFTIDGVSRPHLCRTVRNANRRILESVLEPHDEESIKRLADSITRSATCTVK